MPIKWKIFNMEILKNFIKVLRICNSAEFESIGLLEEKRESYALPWMDGWGFVNICELDWDGMDEANGFMGLTRIVVGGNKSSISEQ